MNGMLQQFRLSLRLHYRNKMALLYSYLFPLIFLSAFWVLYRHENVPLVRHIGELLTVGVLGGACFGLPTTMVSERERGVWRRYRLAPVSTAALVVSIILARYCILITSALLQLGLALALGMPLPAHPFALAAAFTFVAFAFVGLGLVMAMMADNVPAVQALGQCIFLPMLIIGGVAVPLASLPVWAQHVSAFFPGRYAVEALQACVVGAGLGTARFDLLALLIIGAAGCLAGSKMFRWDVQQRFATRSGKGWVTVALAAWAAVGLLAESRGRIVTRAPESQAVVRSAPARSAVPGITPALSAAEMAATKAPSTAAPAAAVPAAPKAPAAAAPPAARTSAGTSPETGPARAARGDPAPLAPAAPPSTATSAPAASKPEERPAGPAEPSSWKAVTLEQIDRDLVFDRLPADSGIVTPIAPDDEEPDPDVATDLEFVREHLPQWQPGKVADPVQRARNYLYVAAVPDVFQLPIERYIARVVFDRMQEDIPKDQLIQALYWIALHPADGDETAVDQLWALHLGNGRPDMLQARDRVALYAVKLLGRLTGHIKPA
jgi:ABC-type transport system involved in cytochrome c biogenesis permease component